MFHLSNVVARLRSVLARSPRTGRGSQERRRKSAGLPLLLEELEARDVPSLAGNQLFPSDNPWNQKISQAPVAGNSAALISSIGGATPLHPDFGAAPYLGSLNGIPYNIVAGNSTAKVSVVIDNYASESDIVPVPMPANPVLEGDGGSSSGTDHHLIVYDKDNNNVYEFFGASRPSQNADGRWHAKQESVWYLSKDYFRPEGWTSADAAGLPILPGLVRPDEVLDQGVINHALRITVDLTRNSYIYPAEHAASSNSSTSLPRMGERLRLKSSYVIASTLPAMDRVILQALKDYGAIVADNGGNMFVSGSPSTRWNDDTLHALTNVHASDFEVVDLAPRVTRLSQASGVAGTSLTITGLNFSGGAGLTHIYFGTTQATSFTINSDSSITVTAPTHAAGTVDVTVHSKYGVSKLSTADQFTYSTTNNTPPTVATAASASPSTVTGKTTSLSVLGADNGGEANLVYTWTVTGPAAVQFTANGTNAAKNVTATFRQAGAYTFTATICDAGGLTTSSSVGVQVNRKLTSIVVTPASATVVVNGTQQFSASARDQFGIKLPTQPAFSWSLPSGIGQVSASGLYTAPASTGSATIRATSGSVSGSATATIVAVKPFTAHINFTSSGGEPYAGYYADTGLVYGLRSNGLTYGWNADNTGNTRDRDAGNSPDERYDSLAQMEAGSNPDASWSIAVPNGTYTVHIVAGDPLYNDSVYKIAAEGVTVVDGTPTKTAPWVEGTATVTVTDGKLTITNVAGSVNNKIAYIDITQVL